MPDSVHRRKSSREDADGTSTPSSNPVASHVVATQDTLPATSTPANSKKASLYSRPHFPPLSSGASSRIGFGFPSAVTNTSPLNPNSPTSPLYDRLGSGEHSHRSRTHSTPAMVPAHHASHSHGSAPLPSPTLVRKASQPHMRIHSRNLSVFFPRPGAPPPAIAEDDGTQETSASESVLIPSGSDSKKREVLGAGFTFGGGKPPPGAVPLPALPSSHSRSTPSTSKRRGHHHKHSLSHNFFSFMEPSSSQSHSARSASVTRVSITASDAPWVPAPEPSSESSSPEIPHYRTGSTSPRLSRVTLAPQLAPSTKALGFAVVQFVIGACVWAGGQRGGALSCTGLGYWIIFDALGVGICGWIARGGFGDTMGELKRPFG